MYSDVSVVILAAGKSERMKFPKPFLLFNEKTFLEHICEVYNPIVKKIIVVFNSENKKIFEFLKINLSSKTQIVINDTPERCISVKKGVEKIETNFTFIQNIDHPSINIEVLSKLYNNREKADVIIPTYRNKKGHPILFNKKVILSFKKNNFICQNLKNYLQQFENFSVKVNRKEILENINNFKQYKNLLCYG